MNSVDLSHSLGRPAIWITRTEKRFGLPVLEDSRYRRIAVLLLARIRSLQLCSYALLSIRSSETWGKECNWGVSMPLVHKRKRLVGTRLSHSSFRERSPKIFGSEDAWSGTTGGQMGEDALRLLGEYRDLLQEVREIVGRERKVLWDSLQWTKTAGLPPRHL